MKNQFFIILITSIVICITGCENVQNVEQSKQAQKQELKQIKDLEANYKKLDDTLKSNIIELKKKKDELLSNEDYFRSKIHDIIKHSFLDHIILGSKNLSNSELFFNKALGFSVKKGKPHKNGIENLFIEFADSSEIEILSVDIPRDPLAKKYKIQLENENLGLQFAIRSNSIDQLANNFKSISSDYSILTKQNNYSTLSKNNTSEDFPFFFIQYKNNPTGNVKHDNKTSGISSVWLSTPNIRKSIIQYSDFGFSLVDTLTVADIDNKTASMKNDNFEIILIEDNNYAITGVTIKTNFINNMQEMLIEYLKEDVRIIENKRGKSIYLSPQITKSIWFEFLEN